MKEFKTFHPIINFIYFMAVIGFSMFFLHPVCLGISLFSGFTYSVFLKGKKALKTTVMFTLPLMLAAAIMNCVFNHRGITILTYFPSGNPLTLESVIYGIGSAIMLVNVILWFSCYNEIVTSDKFIYLFGRIIPSVSLIFSMTLRFVPRFINRFNALLRTQKCIGHDMSKGNIIERTKNGLSILSIMITWAFESSIETSDSMKARGYGIPHRTAFCIFKFGKRDAIALTVLTILIIYILLGSVRGQMYFICFPAIKAAKTSVFGTSVFGAYATLCVFPLIIELWEVLKWYNLKLKI